MCTLHIHIHICLDLEKCTEDEAGNPPLVLAARHLPKVLFEEGITKEPIFERDAAAEKRISKVPLRKTKSKPDDTPGKGEFRERAATAGKDVKPKKERVEKIPGEKDKKGNLETTFHVLLQRNVNVNSKNNTGITALHAACERGITAMVKELLMVKGIEINKKDDQDNTPLHTACVSGEKDVVFTLIEAGANVMEGNEDEMTPLHVAVVERKLEIVKIILDMHACDKEELLRAIEKGGHSPFLLAVKSGDEEMVKFFMDNGANLMDQNGNGANALHLATSLNKVMIMELIYDAEYGEELLDEEDWDGCTPMHYAAKYNQVEALEFLLDK